MPKLIILRGNSGSGKTSAAKALQEKFGPNTMRLSHDMVRMEILYVWGAEGLARSQPLMIHLLQYGKAHSEITVLEGILPAEDYRPLFETAVKEYGQDIFAYYYDLPFAETLRRHGTKPNRDEFGEADMRRWWRGKDLLPMIPEQILDETVSLEDAVSMIYRQVCDKNPAADVQGSARYGCPEKNLPRTGTSRPGQFFILQKVLERGPPRPLRS